ncbi:hypothetical protein, partial [Burkholderia vietnamiensis]|uniref:hypothetical protein n=1 Tax=Burkholderia vietnamiensis TaxID=60552 RepID=UPI003B9755CE
AGRSHEQRERPGRQRCIDFGRRIGDAWCIVGRNRSTGGAGRRRQRAARLERRDPVRTVVRE